MLSRIIRENVKKPLSIEMLRTIVPSWCRVEFYDKLSKFKTLREALQGKTCICVLYQIHDKKRNVQNKAGHFILINTANGTELPQSVSK